MASDGCILYIESQVFPIRRPFHCRQLLVLSAHVDPVPLRIFILARLANLAAQMNNPFEFQALSYIRCGPGSCTLNLPWICAVEFYCDVTDLANSRIIGSESSGLDSKINVNQALGECRCLQQTTGLYPLLR